MSRTLWIAALALVGCKGIEGPWEGTCGTTIGDLYILTGDMGEAGAAPGWTGEVTLYRPTEAILEFPDGGRPDVSADMVVCESKEGCTIDNDSLDRNMAILTVYDVNDLALVTGTGELKGKTSLTGQCQTNFPGLGDFAMERTNKGPGD